MQLNMIVATVITVVIVRVIIIFHEPTDTGCAAKLFIRSILFNSPQSLHHWYYYQMHSSRLAPTVKRTLMLRKGTCLAER